LIGLNRVKTWILIAALGGLFVLIGAWFGGSTGAIVALAIALVFNFSLYWFSDRIATATTRSKPVTEQEAPELYRIVRELTQINQMPMPRIYISDMMQPNAFATGRDPDHAVVAVTRGIPEILDEREPEGCWHTSSPRRQPGHPDRLDRGAIGMSITFLARFAFWFGRGRPGRGSGSSGLLLAWVLAPSRRRSSRWP
jgi:heat shock protein HtpX